MNTLKLKDFLQAIKARVNHKIKKDVGKVVDTVDVEDITEKAVFCRCWKSQNVCNFFLLTYYCVLSVGQFMGVKGHIFF